MKQISKSEFKDVLSMYAQELGSRLGQVRVYLEFDGKTTVIKRND